MRKPIANHRRGKALIVAALHVSLLLAVPSSAGRDASGAAFDAVKKEVTDFRGDKKRRQFRHHYLKLVRQMRSVAAKHPTGGRADDALYVAAQLLEELSEASRVGRDLEDAVSAYEEVAQRYPKSNLADDALFAAAKMRLSRMGDREGARALLIKIDQMGGRADFRPQARELLARLPKAPEVKTKKPKAVVEKPDVNAILARVKAEVGTPTATSAKTPDVVTGGDATPSLAPAPERQIEILPDPPPLGTPSRRVQTIRHSRSKSESVLKVRLAKAVGIERGEIPAKEGQPRRIFFDFSPAKLGKHHIKPIIVDDGVVKRVRAGQYDRDTVRLVVELEGAEEPSLSVQRKPFELRLTVPLAPKADNKVAAAIPAHVVKKKPKPAEVKKRLGSTGSPGGVSLSQQMGLKVTRIVLDPGHGGRDTGAIGKKGTREKDVTLKVAKEVKRQIEEKMPNVEVLLTRDSDKTLELADRTNFANSVGADLFISIHANANPSRKAKGVETYYLNITHDRYAIRLAARENAEAGKDASISDLEYILADLAMKSNVDDSIRLGRAVQRGVVGSLRKKYRGVKDLGLKHALFFVLMGSRMPAILVETSFISNPTEEQRLRNKAYQARLAKGIVSGIQRFVEERQAFYTAKR